MTKNKSNQFRKAKYLLLLPLLASMLIYTSCETNQVEEIQEVEIRSTKKIQTSYSEYKGEIKKYLGKKETYLDSYFGDKLPKGIEIGYENLTNQEKEEYNAFYKEYKRITKSKNSISDFLELRLFRDQNNRGILATIIKIPKANDNKLIDADEIVEVEEINEDVPFALIENVPVFPGCKGTRKEKSDCLNSSIRKVIAKNFNGDLAKTTGLSKGKKKIWVQFRIDEQGNIGDINAIRAPNSKLKDEAERVVRLLPKMIPGKQRGKTVGMKYTLPISFNVK